MKTTTINNVGVDIALKIIEEGKRPMSIDEIKAKYQLEFPFSVVKIINTTEWVSTKLKVGTVIKIDGYTKYNDYLLENNTWTPPNVKQWNLAGEPT